ncbi:hypothetical protein HMPREF0731_2096, partial [Pseudoroseomonas cervicalis ATCC 49957]
MPLGQDLPALQRGERAGGDALQRGGDAAGGVALGEEGDGGAGRHAAQLRLREQGAQPGRRAVIDQRGQA